MNRLTSLVDDIETLSDDLNLDAFARMVLKDFIIENCKKEYMRGNKSGICWKLKQMRDNNVTS